FFDLCIKTEPENNYRGSHFQNAASEYPRPEMESEVRIRQAAMAHRTWVRDTMAELLAERFGYTSRSLADQLMIFLDGGLVGSKMARHVGPLETARDMAKQLLLTVPMSYHISPSEPGLTRVLLASRSSPCPDQRVLIAASAGAGRRAPSALYRHSSPP